MAAVVKCFAFLLLLSVHVLGQPINPGPESRVPSTNVSDVHFLLWTRQNPAENSEQELVFGDVASVSGSFFDPNRQTKILIHGYTDNGRVSWIQRAKDAYLQVGDFNVISVDWELLAGPSPYYFLASDNVIPVGFRIGAFVTFLVDNFGCSLDDFHPTGFSLGGQVVGNVGHALNGELPRITGLDPAGFMFHTAPDSAKISKSSARFVDIIHTAGLWVGTDEPSGHVDFYPNRGTASQPGCEGEDVSLICSHMRAPDLFIESITTTQGFKGVKCDSWSEYESGQCDGNEINLMGEFTNTDQTGYFFLRTNGQPPFAMP